MLFLTKQVIKPHRINRLLLNTLLLAKLITRLLLINKLHPHRSTLSHRINRLLRHPSMLDLVKLITKLHLIN